MSRSDWSARDKVIAGAFFLFASAILAATIYWTGAQFGYQEGRRIEAASEHRAYAKQDVQQACRSTEPSGVFECVYDAIEAAKENERGEQDLTAQQGMERWAFAMFAAAVAQTLVAGAALFFLMKDLRQNRESAEKQLRAYVGLEKSPVTEVKIGERLGVELKFKNAGQTPALKVQAAAVFGVDHFPLPDASARQLENAKKTSAASILPGTTFRLPIISSGPAMNQATLDAIKSGTMAVYCWGTVSYVDVFGGKQHSDFSLMMGGDLGGVPTKLMVTKHGNDST